ncbi:universal stress protein YxiE-like [Gossypium australe]|uniref:Universal stress protein YxiE-like n=1 Tax=Gossypium australe TaxID=47621 RepID=A0A5B6X153_9ROSI|nr:universal stress protein YxiE-like [Gossypium australe]
MAKDRKIGVAMDFSWSSKSALRWAIDNLVDKGDTFYIIHINPSSPNDSTNTHLAQSGSPLIPLAQFRQPEIMNKYDVKIQVVTKLYWGGDAREKILDAIEDLKLDSLVMGSRGLGTLQRIILGSVSNYVLTYAPCPVTIVKEPPSSSS